MIVVYSVIQSLDPHEYYIVLEIRILFYIQQIIYSFSLINAFNLIVSYNTCKTKKSPYSYSSSTLK